MFEHSIDLTGYFEVQRFCFAKLGVNITSGKRIVENYAWCILPPFALAMLAVAVAHYATLNISDIGIVTSSLGIVLQIILSVSKWVTFLLNRHEIVGLVRRILAWNTESTPAERVLLFEENKKDVRFCRLYFCMYFMAASTSFVIPLFFALRSYLRDGTYRLEPPLPGTYLIDYSKPLNYLLLDIYTLPCALAVICTSVSVDGLVSWFTRNIIAQFRILQLRFEQAAHENQGNVSAETVVSCIKYHNRIIEAADKLNDAFSTIVFVKFSYSCLQICCVAFQLTKLSSASVFQLVYGSTVAFQFILYCWSGQGLKDASLDIADCIYDVFKWEKVGLKQRKMLLLSMQRSQRSCNLAGMFFTVDLSLFLWVFRTAGSFIALLLSVETQ